MVLSMTGFGTASAESAGVFYRVEIRTVNNRYFKAAIKLPEQFARFEAEIERQLREGLGRGSAMYVLRVKDDQSAGGYEINAAAVRHYVQRLTEIAGGKNGAQIDLATLLEVPGVCEPAELDELVLASRFAVVQKLNDEAIRGVIEMRMIEGAALQKDLEAQCQGIRARLADVGQRCPAVVEDYHRRLQSRVQQLLSDGTVQLDQDILSREVAIFAERCDVNEEISRLSSHLEQFTQLCSGTEDAGRKLDFLSQEMLREANTIGSKANDAQIARHIVEIKAAIDRIKEQVQNVA
jgi:uncharacterized protein (TIGR00255 family)